MKSISSDYLKIILVLLFIYFAQSAFAAEKCALSHQLTDSSKKIHCLDKFDFSKRKYSNFNMTLDIAARSSNCWSVAIPIEESCNNIIGFSAKDPLWCMDPGVRKQNNKSALSMCNSKGCKCSLVIDANDIVDTKLFFSYAMRETELVVHNNPEIGAKESINNKSELKNSQPENNQSIINAEKEKQIQQDLKQAQALKAIEDVKQNELEKELKKAADELKVKEKTQQDLKLAQETKAIEDIKAKAQQELKLAQEAKAREDAISEARQKAQQELRQSQEAEARAAALEKLKEEEYQKEKKSAAAKARVLEEIKAEAYARERAILEAKAKAQADLKAEEIAKIQAEEQAKAQAIIDEKNRVAAAKAAVEQAKKNREQEIAEERTKIAESQKKIEELNSKALDLDNPKLDKQLSKSASAENVEGKISSNAKIEKEKYSKSGKVQDEALCGMLSIEVRGFNDKCINIPIVDAGEEFSAKLYLTIREEHKKLLSNYKFEDEAYSETLECEKINPNKLRTCALKRQKTLEENEEVLKNICIAQAKNLMSFITFNKIEVIVSGRLNDFTSRERMQKNNLICSIETVYSDKNKFCEMTQKLRDEQILLSKEKLKILKWEINQDITGETKENHHVYIDSINLIAKKSNGTKYTKELARWGTRTATDIVNKKEYCINFIDEAVAKYYGK